eukprot:scaffold52280_cov61-Phaeocystis_antarctica.AAC.2
MLWPRHAPRESWCAAERKPHARSRGEAEAGWVAVAANLRLDREPDQQRDDWDERDKRRAADDRPGLAANEVAPLVVEGVDAALDPLAELAGGRHRLAVC